MVKYVSSGDFQTLIKIMRFFFRTGGIVREGKRGRRGRRRGKRGLGIVGYWMKDKGPIKYIYLSV